MTLRDPSEYGKVAVLLGGKSAERDVSLMSGQAVYEALQRKGVDAHKVDAKDSVITQLQGGSFDRAFIILHGRDGEDGVMQGALELLDIPYTGSGVMASALGMDKLKTKEIWIANNIPTPRFCVVDKSTDLDSVIEQLGLPIIVKPLNEGSSIGMSKVSGESELPDAIVAAMKFDDKVLAEKWVVGCEYTVTILGDKALPPIRLETSNQFYDYEAKYISNETQYHCPCGLEKKQESELQILALNAFNLIGAKGWGRIDIMVDDNGEPYLIEINTLPGMTSHSLVPMAAKAEGVEFDDLVLNILESSMS